MIEWKFHKHGEVEGRIGYDLLYFSCDVESMVVFSETNTNNMRAIARFKIKK